MKAIRIIGLVILCTLVEMFTGGARGGVLTVLHKFTGSDGQYPQCVLVPGTNGSFHGATSYGGANGNGAIYEITTNGVFTLVASLAFTNGANPYGRLRAVGGTFYGTTANGGPFNHGTVYLLTASNTILPQLVFTNTTAEGSSPFGGLTADTNGVLFGTTLSGGAFGYGTVFRMNTGDSQPTVVHAFAGGDGGYPYDTLLLNTNGWLYGTTQSGGSNGLGTVFKLSPAGGFTNFFSFALTNGAYPWAGLIQAADGNLYGTTAQGGVGNYGTIFRVTTNDAVEMVAAFGYTNGANPYAELTQRPDGYLYGVARSGGASGRGTIFRVATNGALASLLSFNYGNGSEPYGGMVLGGDGHLYGTTIDGGGGAGIVFRFIPNPPAPVIEAVTATNGDTVLAWSAVAGGDYQMQYKTNLAQTNWSNLGLAVTATNSTVFASDVAPPDPQRFYRVLLLQP